MITILAIKFMLFSYINILTKLNDKEKDFKFVIFEYTFVVCQRYDE